MTERAVAPITPGRAAPARAQPSPDDVPSDLDPRPRVWIDQDLCTGDGICAEIAPEVFRIHWDGLAYVVAGNDVLEHSGATVPVDRALAEAVIESAAKCPGDCIYVIAGRDGTVHGDRSPRAAPDEGDD